MAGELKRRRSTKYDSPGIPSREIYTDKDIEEIVEAVRKILPCGNASEEEIRDHKRALKIELEEAAKAFVVSSGTQLRPTLNMLADDLGKIEAAVDDLLQALGLSSRQMVKSKVPVRPIEELPIVFRSNGLEQFFPGTGILDRDRKANTTLKGLYHLANHSKHIREKIKMQADHNEASGSLRGHKGNRALQSWVGGL